MVFAWLSSAAAAVERKLRASMAKIIRDHSDPPKRTVKQIVQGYAKAHVNMIISEAFKCEKKYLTNPNVTTMMQFDNSTNEEVIAKAELCTRFAHHINQHADLSSHLALLHGVYNLINETAAGHPNQVDYKTASRRFTQLMNNYCVSCTQVFNKMNFQSARDFGDRANLRSMWSPGTSRDSYFVVQGGSHDEIEQHKHLVDRLLQRLEDTAIPDEVAVLVLTESIGTAGFALLGYVEYPLFVNLFPDQWILSYRDNLWDRRKDGTEDSDGEVTPPSDVNSKYTTDHAEKVKEALDNLTLDDVEELYKKFANTDEPYHVDTDDEEEPEQQEEAPQEEEAPEPPQQQQPPPPPPQNPLLPDDADYVPDSFLARRVRDLTKHFQDLDEMDMTRDHMERFDVNDYTPVPLMKRQVRRTDSIVFRGQSTTSQKYVVTFTRQLRKPIFNPVN